MKYLLCTAAFVLIAASAFAQYRLLGETVTTAGGGSESAAYTYDTFGDFVGNTYSSWSWTQIDWSETWHTAELAHDGKYRLMGEQNTSVSTEESTIYTYDTYADLLANTYSSWSYTNINWSSTFKTVGLAYDGQYRLMGETDTSATTEESVVYTYDTIDDLINNNFSSWSYTDVDWIPEFETGGLAYDGKYQLLGEMKDTSAGAGSESAVYTYDTFADLLANNYSSWSFTQIDWSSNFHTGGFVGEFVPEPSTFVVLGIGFAALALRRRRG